MILYFQDKVPMEASKLYVSMGIVNRCATKSNKQPLPLHRNHHARGTDTGLHAAALAITIRAGHRKDTHVYKKRSKICLCERS